MHSLIRERLEDVLAGRHTEPVRRHLAECEECREHVAEMTANAQALRLLRAPAAVEVRAGFYARVLERIDAQRPAITWRSFFESAFALRIALASLALVLMVGTYLYTNDDEPEIARAVQSESIHNDDVSIIEAGQLRDPDAVLASLASYQEH